MSAALSAVAVLTSVAAVAYVGRFAPPTTSFMQQRRAEARADGRDDFELVHRWVDLDDVAASLPLAVLCSEDQRFASHGGFDTRAIREALAERVRGGELRGASTLTQQVAKNLFLWPGKSLLRKGVEAYFTLLIEASWDKRRILEVYVNVAEWGDGIFGVQAAARAHFGRDAARLTEAQSALLAAVLPNPVGMHAYDPSPYVERRARWIQRQMRRLRGSQHVRGI